MIYYNNNSIIATPQNTLNKNYDDNYNINSHNTKYYSVQHSKDSMNGKPVLQSAVSHQYAESCYKMQFVCDCGFWYQKERPIHTGS